MPSLFFRRHCEAIKNKESTVTLRPLDKSGEPDPIGMKWDDVMEKKKDGRPW